MTLWRPDPSTLRRPAYLALAEQIARAIADGKLESGTRLQTHRQMADELRLSVQTVSRAYEELIRRNLISGETGRGTFVRSLRREPDPPYLPERLGEVIDLSILKPVCEPMHLERMKKALGWLAENLPASSALSFRPNVVFPRHRAVAVEWLRTCGLDVPASNISLTNGATAAMTVALMSAAPPGSKVATEGIGHHTLTPLASYLGLTLQGLAIDEQGIIPEALDECCQEHGIRAVFVQPSVINPTATLMGLERRALSSKSRDGMTLRSSRATCSVHSWRIAPLRSQRWRRNAPFISPVLPRSWYLDCVLDISLRRIAMWLLSPIGTLFPTGWQRRSLLRLQPAGFPTIGARKR